MRRSLSFSLLMLASAAVSAQTLQEAMQRALEVHPEVSAGVNSRLSADANLQAYILIIVRNKCLDWLRAQSLHAKIEQEVYELRRRVLAADIRSLQAFNPEEIFSAEVAAIVRQSLDRLPELTREVFVARRFEELSYKEIAEKYGITVRRVEFELEKAVKQLRVALKDYLPVLLMLLSDNILRS